MRRLSPAYRALAQWLLAKEAENAGSSDPIDAAESAFGKLHGELARLIGSDGYRAVLTRALHLAEAEHPVVGKVAAAPEGATYPALLEGLRASLVGVDPAEVRSGLAAVLGNLLWLLSTFIGAALTRQLAQSVWPELPDLGRGSTSEDADRCSEEADR